MRPLAAVVICRRIIVPVASGINIKLIPLVAQYSFAITSIVGRAHEARTAGAAPTRR